MILDLLSQWRRYAPLSPHFERAFAFLQQPSPGSPGRQEIAGDEVYAIVQDHLKTPLAARQFEVHRRYLDIHCVTAGEETLYWTPLSTLTQVTKPYNEEADEALYALVPHPQALHLRAGQFAIFFPEDGHIPLCTEGAPNKVRKVVVKVRL